MVERKAQRSRLRVSLHAVVRAAGEAIADDQMAFMVCAAPPARLLLRRADQRGEIRQLVVVELSHREAGTIPHTVVGLPRHRILLQLDRRSSQDAKAGEGLADRVVVLVRERGREPRGEHDDRELRNPGAWHRSGNRNAPPRGSLGIYPKKCAPNSSSGNLRRTDKKATSSPPRPASYSNGSYSKAAKIVQITDIRGARPRGEKQSRGARAVQEPAGTRELVIALDAGLGDDLGPALEVRFDDAPELLRRAADRVGGLLGELLPDLGKLQHAHHLPVHARNGRLRRLRRREQRDPGIHLVIGQVELFRDGRHVRRGGPAL